MSDAQTAHRTADTDDDSESGALLADLTAFQRDLLFSIESLNGDGERPHGLAVKADLEAEYPGEIHHGRLYPNLDELVDKGLVNKSELDQRTNGYALTRRGTREVRKHHTWEAERLGADS